MSTYKSIVYMVLDLLKLVSDDASFTEEHVIFLANKFRSFLLKLRYSDIKKQIPESNYQTICLNLNLITSPDNSCGTTYLISDKKIPTLMPIGNPQIYPNDFFLGSQITLVPMERMLYVGYNKFLQNIIYGSLGPDSHLYLKSNNPQFLYLDKVRITGIFEDPEEVSELSCDSDEDKKCDVLDRDFPIEEALISPLIELCVKELSGSIYLPSDDRNNSSDDLSNTPVKK